MVMGLCVERCVGGESDGSGVLNGRVDELVRLLLGLLLCSCDLVDEREPGTGQPNFDVPPDERLGGIVPRLSERQTGNGDKRPSTTRA